MRDPEDYRLTFRTPEGCNVTNCTTFVGIDTNTGNPGILDIYMEGEALGWVAVGFTATRNMVIIIINNCLMFIFYFFYMQTVLSRCCCL